MKLTMNKGGNVLGNDSGNFSCDNVLPFARKDAGMVLHCTVICRTCLARTPAKESRETIIYCLTLFLLLLLKRSAEMSFKAISAERLLIIVLIKINKTIIFPLKVEQ